MERGIVPSGPLGISPKALQAHLDTLCQWERVSGKEGELRAADYIVSQLGTMGIPHEVHEFPAFVSYPVRATLRTGSSTADAIRCITHSFSASVGGRTAPLARTPAEPPALAHVDLHGRIAVTEGMALPWVVRAVEGAGAVGHINLCHNPMPHEMCLSTVWGTPTEDQMGRLPGIPVVSTDAEGASTLRGLMATGEVTATLATEVWTGWANLRLPVATIGGPAASEDFVLAGSHYDSWYVGATDTATSDALLLEMARVLWERREGLRRSVRIAWWPGHSQGRYAGSAWYADRFHGDLERHGVAYLNLDGPGSRHVDHFNLVQTAELAEFNRRTVEEILGMPAGEHEAGVLGGPRGRPGRSADESFLAIGLAAWAAYGEMPPDHPDRGRYAAASGGGWYWHTPADTLDKVDLGLLVKEAELFSTQVLAMASAKVLPFAMKHMAEDFLSLLHHYRGAAGDFLDFEPARAEARRFRENCGNLEVHRRAVESKGDQWKAASLDHTLLRLTRILNPILYTVGGPHHPDPAVPQPLLPGLAMAQGLGDRSEGERGGMVVGLRRELNRISEGLAHASDVLEAHLRAEMEED